MTRICVETPLYPTEDVEKVRRAILAIFPEVDIAISVNLLTGTGTDIRAFEELIRSQHIRDAARSVLLRNRYGNSVTFKLNKQVASIGKVNFSADPEKEAPLGDITATIEADSEEGLSALIDEIAPDTALLKERRSDAGDATAMKMPKKKKARKFKKSDANAFFKVYDKDDDIGGGGA